MDRKGRQDRKLIPGTIEHNRPFQKEKLNFLENLAARYKGDLNGEERLMLRVLQREWENLAVKLYPNRLFRLIRNLVSSLRLYRNAAAYKTMQSDNTAQLSNELVRSGFGELNSKMISHIKQGQPEFSIPVSYYPKEHDRLDIELKFRQKETGGYEFVACEAKLTSPDLKQVRSHSFAADEPLKFSPQEMANLLHGRAVLVQETDVPWKSGKWVQFDLNDKDAGGNYRMKEKSEDNFDPIAIIRDMGIKQKHTGLDDERMLHLLLQGEAITLLPTGNNQSYTLELNPFQKSITLYDSNGDKVSNADALKSAQKVTRVVALKQNSALDAKPVKQQKRI